VSEAVGAGALSEDEAQRALQNAINTEISSGWRVESQIPGQATLAKGRHINHIGHGVATVLTCGLWAPVWAISWAVNRRQVQSLSVDQYGNVQRQKL